MDSKNIDRLMILESKVEALSEIITAQVTYLKAIQAEVSPVIDQLMSNPMVKMMFGKGGDNG